MDTIFTRTSTRKYQNKPVEEEKIERLLRAAMAAPSAGNQQPWCFYVVTDKKKLIELSESHQYADCTADAPMAIVVCTYSKSLRYPEFAEIDCAICSENILLEAEELGLGAVWLGIAPLKERIEKVNGILSLPKGTNAFAIIPVGYPIEKHEQQERFDKSRIHRI